MTLEPFLSRIASALQQAGVPAMLTGSVAAAWLGALRSTLDVDFVIDPTAEALEHFVDQVEAQGLYISRDAARDALQHRTMFNVIEVESGWKADLMVRKARAFSESEFARRQPIELAGTPLAIVRIEDLLLAKLEWAQLRGSARQLEDARTLLELAGDTLEIDHIERWATALGVRSEWDRVRGESRDDVGSGSIPGPLP